MNIVIASAFRNSVSYISRYCDQMDGLRTLLEQRGDFLNLLLGYGDSNDGTGEVLYEECSLRLHSTILVGVGHGGHHYGSIVHPGRFKDLSYVWNTLWENIPGYADIVGFVESDLIWQPQALLSLVEGLQGHQIRSPMVYHLDGRFYDTWAFKLNGVNFRNERPYHPMLVDSMRTYDMDSVGSVLFMKADLARQLTWPEEDVVVGVCRQAIGLGARIVLDVDVKVYHP